MITPEKFNKIVSKLPKDKTELAKVELSIASELDASMGKLEKAVQSEKEWNAATKTYNSFAKEVMKQVRKAETQRNKLEESGDKIDKASDILYGEVSDLINKADSAAKELGIKPEAIGAYKKADSLSDKLFTVDARAGFFDQIYW
tara:strand:+ start:3043 stop:3477 length:435 start_codon:yes stop_codon:yes gene_type:complete